MPQHYSWDHFVRTLSHELLLKGEDDHHSASKIVDNDGDTSVDVEQSPDEDKIRHKVAGTEVFRSQVGTTADLANLFLDSIELREDDFELRMRATNAGADPMGRWRWRYDSGGADLVLEYKSAAGDPGTWTVVLRVGDSSHIVPGNIVFDVYTAYQKTISVEGNLVLLDMGIKTIAAGAINISSTVGAHFRVNTEGAAATDDLDTVTTTAGVDRLVILRPLNDTRTVVVKHNTGNIKCIGNADITLDDQQDFVWMLYDGANNVWYAFGGGTAVAGGSGHTIREDGTDLTARTGLNFLAGLAAIDDAGGGETEVWWQPAMAWAMR